MKKSSIPKETLDEVDKWIAGTSHVPEKFANKLVETTKKVTLEIPENLHKKIKLFCVENNLNIKDKLLDIITKNFS